MTRKQRKRAEDDYGVYTPRQETPRDAPPVLPVEKPADPPIPATYTQPTVRQYIDDQIAAGIKRYVCRDHDCRKHAYEDPECNHGADGCTVMMMDVPPRPDYHWNVKAHARVKLEPRGNTSTLPAPPDVAVWVAGDIADDVKQYAQRREAEKRNRCGSAGEVM